MGVERLGFRAGGDPTQQSDVTLNDSDKTFTVPTGHIWILKFITAQLITDATVGNRQIRIEIGDGTNLLWAKNAGAVQAASLTRYYDFASDRDDQAAFDDNNRIRTRIPPELALPAGYTIRIYDSAAVAAATDNLAIRMLVDEIIDPA